jgi:glutamyl-tRNA reductase
MSLVVVSIHERDASVELLGRIAVADRDLSKVLAGLCDSPHLSEAVVLSTCLRTEVYAILERFHDGLGDIQAFFQSRAGGSPLQADLLADQLRVDYDDAAARHLFEVAAGVDSAVLGEGEILRQVRTAAERAREERAAGPVLDGLFRHAIEVGKRARTETAIARGVTSLAHVAAAVAEDRAGGSLAGRRVVVVGAGEMGEGVATALTGGQEPAAGAIELVIANRTKQRADALAAQLGGRGIGLTELVEEIALADVVVTATSSTETIVEVGALSEIASTRRERPLVIVDAAMPRDVDPAVGELAGVELFDLDHLRRFAEREMAARRNEIGRVEAIVDEEIERYRTDLRSRSVAPLIAALHERAEATRAGELAHFSSRLARLSPEDRALVETLTRRIVQKIVHEPSVNLKQSAGSARGERLAEALRALFDL